MAPTEKKERSISVRLFDFLLRQNPFTEMEHEIIRSPLLPYQSVNELTGSACIDRRQLVRFVAIILIQLLFLVRLASMALFHDRATYYQMMGFFYGLTNTRALMFSLTPFLFPDRKSVV